ncbi:Cu/Zn superoxide dismutase [Catenulispora sp. MAP5-51]|uniref:CHRD domain-containing protein n=1 Tax=Catenulispora sp. MAP5-51 TaxID=3156298 RepID=UPI0035150376
MRATNSSSGTDTGTSTSTSTSTRAKGVGAAALAVLAVTGTVLGLGLNGTAQTGTTPGASTTTGAGTPAADGQAVIAEAAGFVQPDTYAFKTVDDTADPTFNQLLGINSQGVIAGYFGSGAAGHPNQGYTVHGDASSFAKEDFPGSVQTQVTGLNDRGVTVGFFSHANTANQVNDDEGWYALDGRFHQVVFPASSTASPPVEQLLGVNDSDIAVGFYNDAAGNSHGFRYDINRHTFHTVAVSGATSTTAAAIDARGDVAGFYTGANGNQSGFLLTASGKLTPLNFPGATMTQALGVNDKGEVVGLYQTGSGDTAQTHGFTWTAKQAYLTVDDPSGAGGTTVNGVNDAGTLVGFYVDAQGNTDGMLATPQKTTTTRHLSLNPMPQGSVTLGTDRSGVLTAHVSAFGFTPGSQHAAEVVVPGRAKPVATLAPLTADAAGRIEQTVTTAGAVTRLPSGSRFQILLGTGSDALSAQPIAQSRTLPQRPSGDDPMPLQGVDVKSDTRLNGSATLVFDSATHRLTVTVDASGLTPGAHAAHIHLGSCASQGGVQYMLTDLRADSRGDVVHQTQTIDDVAAMPAPGTAYLNVHLGDMNSILANGRPTPAFRPLLCGNI